MNKRNILIIAVILMTVGFASVATNLMFKGNVTIGNSIDDYDIRFTSTSLDGVEDGALIIDDGKKINYNINLSNELGTSSELMYVITNNSSLYDAEVNIVCAAKGLSSQPDLYTIDTTNIPEIIKSQQNSSGSVRVSLIGETTEVISEGIECSLSLKSLHTVKEEPLYKEEILNGADPVVSGELIPVTLASDGVVTYANKSEEWYNYQNKEWANAVILNKDAKTYSVGEVILEDDIEAYFVWIPRYKYQLFHTEQEYDNSATKPASQIREIKVEFESKNIEASAGSKDEEWLTHPAFTNFDVNGLWVGKFETGYKGANSAANARITNYDPSQIIIKPSKYSWTNNNIVNMFKNSYDYKRELNSHMMKNTEWGAVAYLSHSIYGINDEVRINNNTNYLTGYAANTKDAAASPSTNKAYNTETGYKASTTGNITGIYDMSGGASEMLASYIDGYGTTGGFTDEELIEYEKYFDKYSSDSYQTSYGNRILGDATGEMGPFYSNANLWYGDSSTFVDSEAPWFNRGGRANQAALTGQFNFNRGLNPLSVTGYRIVLA